MTTPASEPDVTLPLAARLITRLPWLVKRRIAAHPLAWRLVHGAARRCGWGPRSLGWHTAPNGPFAGIRLFAGHTNHFWIPFGTYETGVVGCLTALVRARRPAEVWDIGAHRGLTALACAAAGAARVVAFEPAPENVEALRTHLEANPRLAPSIQVERTAIAEADGTVTFAVNVTDSSIGHIVSDDEAASGGVAATTVPARSVDSIAASLGRGPSIIKIDVEGAEAMVVRGASRTLRAYRPVLLIELHTPASTRDTLSALDRAGYQWQRLEADGSLEAWSDTQGVHHVLAMPAPSR